MSDTIDLDEAKRLLGELTKQDSYFPWQKDGEEDERGFYLLDGNGVLVDEEAEIDYALHAVNNYAALVERCEKAEAEVARLTGELEDQGPHWPSCPGACGGCR